MTGHRFITVNVSSLSFAKILIILAALAFAYVIRDVLAIIFVSLILASALSPLVAGMEKFGIHRILGILFIYIFLIGIIVFTVILLIPPIVSEYQQLLMQYPAYSDRIIRFLQNYSPDTNFVEQAHNLAQTLRSNIIEFAPGIFLKIFDIIRGIFAFLIVFVVTFYMIAEEKSLHKALHIALPRRYRDLVEQIIEKIQKKIGLWLRGQIFLSFIIFALSFIGLTILGVDYALLLALIAGFTEFMPIIGPIIGSIPAIFIAFNQSPFTAVEVALLYYVIQHLENHILVPRVMQRAVGINPLVSVIALLIGAKIGGILGILLAIPVATMVSVILGEFVDTETEPEETPIDSEKLDKAS